MGWVRCVRSAGEGGFGMDTGEPRRFTQLAIITGKVVCGWDRCVEHPEIVADTFSRVMGYPPASACRSLIDRLGGLYRAVS